MNTANVSQNRSENNVETLTRRQYDVLACYRTFTAKNGGLTPTLGEVSKALGVSKVTVLEHARKLVRKGLLMQTKPNVSRNIAPVQESIGVDERIFLSKLLQELTEPVARRMVVHRLGQGQV